MSKQITKICTWEVLKDILVRCLKMTPKIFTATEHTGMSNTLFYRAEGK